MRYASGEEARKGDRVRLGDSEGIVVCSLDTGEFSEKYSREDWEYLRSGILVDFQALGLIHYVEPEQGLQLVSRRVAESASS